MIFSARGRVRRGSSPRAVRSRLARAFALGEAVALAAVIVIPGLVAAHPLGNFTINHYAGIRVEPDRITLDVVIDQAEIPTFRARLAFDRDGDGDVSAEEADAARPATSTDLAGSLDLRVGGAAQTLRLVEAGLSFPPGAGGLPTMRSVCGFEVTLAEPIGDRVGAATPLGRARSYLPLVASVVVLGFGTYLTFQALSGAPTL